MLHDPVEEQNPNQLEKIWIPSNLQEILNSINKSGTHRQTGPNLPIDDDEEYTPSPVMQMSYSPSADYIPSRTLSYLPPPPLPPTLIDGPVTVEPKGTSKLAHMTEAELLSMVPDDMDLPPPPKKTKYVVPEPLPPGIEDEEYVP